MVNIDTKIGKFVNKRLELAGSAECQKLVLLHEIEGESPRPLLHCTNINRSRLEDEKLRVTDEIIETAQSHASESTRPQKYSIAAYASDSTILEMCVFRLRGNKEGFGDDSEPATQRGLMSQLMRHNEALIRVFVKSHHDTTTMLAEEIARTRRRNAELEDRHLEMLDTYEKLSMHKHEQEIESIQETASQDRKDRLMGQLEKLLPFVAAKITGQTAVQKFMSTLSPEDLEKLGDMLRPEQLEALGKVMQEGEDMKKLEKKHAPDPTD